MEGKNNFQIWFGLAGIILPSNQQANLIIFVQAPGFNVSWWRHQMETFFALLALCAGNSPVTDEFPSQGPVTRCSDIFFICPWISVGVNNRGVGDLRRHWAHYDVNVMSMRLPCPKYLHCMSILPADCKYGGDSVEISEVHVCPACHEYHSRNHNANHSQEEILSATAWRSHRSTCQKNYILIMNKRQRPDSRC